MENILVADSLEKIRSMEIENAYMEKRSKISEEWKRIKINGEWSNYRISNWGRFQNIKLNTIRDYGVVRNVKRYILVTMHHRGEYYSTGVHRLVALYFHKIPQKYAKQGLTSRDLYPNHIDGVKHHNAAFNLEWVTPKDNMKHAFDEKLCVGIFGENSHLAKITEKQAIEICERIMKKQTNKEIATAMNVTEKTIQHIRSKESWKSLTQKYDFPKLSDTPPNSVPLETVHSICKDIQNGGMKDAEIGKKYGLSREYVRDIRIGKRQTKISQLYGIEPRKRTN